MNSVMLSIRPEWCEKILSGRKTTELRKTKPKLELPFKCYIYCTYGLGLIEYHDSCYPNTLLTQKVDSVHIWGNCCNGKVIGEFICDAMLSHCEMGDADLAEQMSCVKREKIREYAGDKEVFGWHISELKIYDKPLELRNFKVQQSNEIWSFTKRLEKAPQSWCYVMELGG